MQINCIRIIRHEGKNTLCRLLFDYLYYYCCQSATISPFNTARVLDDGILYRSPYFMLLSLLFRRFYFNRYVKCLSKKTRYFTCSQLASPENPFYKRGHGTVNIIFQLSDVRQGRYLYDFKRKYVEFQLSRIVKYFSRAVSTYFQYRIKIKIRFEDN